MANINVCGSWLHYSYKEAVEMIVYTKLWQTMKDKGITQYALINQYHVSAGQLSRLRKNQNISSHTVNTLCDILDCQPGDIMEYVREED